MDLASLLSALHATMRRHLGLPISLACSCLLTAMFLGRNPSRQSQSLPLDPSSEHAIESFAPAPVQISDAGDSGDEASGRGNHMACEKLELWTHFASSQPATPHEWASSMGLGMVVRAMPKGWAMRWHLSIQLQVRLCYVRQRLLPMLFSCNPTSLR